MAKYLCGLLLPYQAVFRALACLIGRCEVWQKLKIELRILGQHLCQVCIRTYGGKYQSCTSKVMAGLVYSPHPHLKNADVKIATSSDVHTVLYWLAELVFYIDSQEGSPPCHPRCLLRMTENEINRTS